MNPLTSTVARLLVLSYRAANPKSRAVSIVKLVRNGGAVKQYGCVLCGAEGPTFSGHYPETKRSKTWCLEHAAAHVAAVTLTDAEIAVAHDALETGRTDAALAILAGAQAVAS